MSATAEMRQESLSRAVQGQSAMNYQTIVEGFMARGIPAGEIIPRVNVFTYNAWLAAGRQVRKGEKGVRVVTFVPMSFKDGAPQGEPKKMAMRPKNTTVFHVSQTDPIESK